MSNSARSQLNGMAGFGGSKSGYNLKTPVGFGVVTSIFGDMKRHFAGSWFEGVDNQQALNSRAIKWKHALSRFSERVVLGAMAEVIVRGDVSAPSLNTIGYLCQRITDENSASSRTPESIAARNKAMGKLKSEGIIRG